jgi:hypothetical protein
MNLLDRLWRLFLKDRRKGKNQEKTGVPMLSDAIKEFEDKYFEGNLFVNEQKTKVHASFDELGRMKIGPWEEPLPKYLLFSLKEFKLLYSSDGSDFRELTPSDIEMKGLDGIYNIWLHDPRVYARVELDEKQRIERADKHVEIFVEYSMYKLGQSLRFPPGELDWIIAAEGEQGKVKFVFKEDHIIALSFQDLTSGEEIRIVFSGLPWTQQ